MKRLCAIIMIFILILSLTVSSADTISEAAEKTRIKIDKQLYPKSTALMSTYMQNGIAAVNGKWFYGEIIQKEKYFGFGKMRLSDLSDKSHFFNKVVEYTQISVDGGWIYYIFVEDNGKRKINKMTISGDNTISCSL